MQATAGSVGHTRRGRHHEQDEARARSAVGYVRRSTDRQEQSIPDQKKAIERYAQEQGLRLLRFYIDDAISGTSTAGRRSFMQLIDPLLVRLANTAAEFARFVSSAAREVSRLFSRCKRASSC